MFILPRRRFIWLRKLSLVLLGLFFFYFWMSRQEWMKFRTTPRELVALTQQGTSLPVYWGWAKDSQKRFIFYLLAGAHDKPVLCLVHGSPGASSAWSAYLSDASLYQHFRLLVFDRPGFGFSQFGEEEKSLSGQVEALRAVLEVIKTPEVILAGHSLGGPVIAKFVMQYPDLVSGLVFLAASVDPHLEPIYWWQKPLEHPLLSWLLPPAFRVSNNEIIPLRGELEKLQMTWPNISQPILIMHGQRDRLVPYENVHFLENQLLYKPELITLRDEDHFFIWTNPQAVITALIDFYHRRIAPKHLK